MSQDPTRAKANHLKDQQTKTEGHRKNDELEIYNNRRQSQFHKIGSYDLLKEEAKDQLQKIEETHANARNKKAA